MTNERLRSKSWLNIQSSNTMMLAMHGNFGVFSFLRSWKPALFLNTFPSAI